MSERKVLTKYYPPDFDPSKVARIKVKKSIYTKVTTMLPMSIRCNTCGEYIARGTKFNAKKQTVEGEDYLGIKIYRFFIRCKRCAAELTIKTDPKNSEYICEFGATRNYEPWKETEEEKETRVEIEKEGKQDAMKALENRTIESKREMEMLEELDELKAQSARNAEIDITQILEHNLKKQQELEKKQEEEDEKLVAEIFKKNLDNENITTDDSGSSSNTIKDKSQTSIKRLLDQDNSKFSSLFSSSTKKIKLNTNENRNGVNEAATATTNNNNIKNKFSNIKVLKVPEKKEEAVKSTSSFGISLMSNYESSDEEDD